MMDLCVQNCINVNGFVMLIIHQSFERRSTGIYFFNILGSAVVEIFAT